MVRIGQDGRSSAHFVAFDDRKAYLFYCSCDAFILAFSEKYQYVEEMKEAIENEDINKIASIIASCESEVKGMDDYQHFIENELEEHVMSMMIEPDYVKDIYEEFEEVEVIPI